VRQSDSNSHCSGPPDTSRVTALRAVESKNFSDNSLQIDMRVEWIRAVLARSRQSHVKTIDALARISDDVHCA
jgi:hypothetical protein